MVLGIAFAQTPDSPPVIDKMPLETDDSTSNIKFVPVDTLEFNTETGTNRNDTFFFAYDSLLSTTDSIVETSRIRRPERNLQLDTTRSVLTRINREKVDLEAPVTFSAKDSLIMEGTNNAFLFGDGNVEYGQFKLNAQEIRLELDESTVYARGATDSIGELFGNPIFKDGGEEY